MNRLVGRSHRTCPIWCLTCLWGKQLTFCGGGPDVDLTSDEEEADTDAA